MVADAGCDPSGREPCDGALEQAVESGVRLEFPPGRYRFEEEHRFAGMDTIGIVGTGERHRDVEFVFPSGYSGIVLGLWDGRDWLLENFTIQQSMDRQTGVGIEIVTHGGFRMRDVEIAGFSPYNKHGGQRGLYCDVIRPDGTARIERYTYKDPSAVGDYPQGVQAFLADEYHRGTLYCRDWHIENAGENGIYASRVPGDVRVEGGFFRNNDISSIRVCGDGSYVKNATVVIDTDNAHPGNVGTYDNTRGIWWESGTLSKAGGVIEGCELILRSTTLSQGLVRIERTAGRVDVRRSRFRNETEWSTFEAIEPNDQVRNGAVSIVAEDLDIEARGPGRPPVTVTGRPGSSLAGISVRTDASSRDGVRLRNAPETILQHASVTAGRYPVCVDVLPSRSRCLVRLVGGRFESPLQSGEELRPLTSRSFGATPRSDYCLRNEFDAGVDAIAIISTGEQGLMGMLLDDDGEVVRRSAAAEPAGTG
jgi:hypothetical protein